MGSVNIPDAIYGYTKTEYLSTFVLIMIGIAIAQMFKSISKMIIYRRGIKFSIILFSWIVFFLSHILIRVYHMYVNMQRLTSSLSHFLAMLGPLILIIIFSPYFLPKFKYQRNMKTYYVSNRTNLFLLQLGLVLFITIVNRAMLNNPHPLPVYISLAYLAFVVIGLFTKKKIFDVGLLVYCYVSSILWLIILK